MALTFGMQNWLQYQRNDPGAPLILCFGDSWIRAGFDKIASRFYPVIAQAFPEWVRTPKWLAQPQVAAPLPVLQ